MHYQIPIKTEGPKRNHVTAFHIFSGILFIVIGAVAFLSPLVMGVATANREKPEISFHFINWIGFAYVLLGFAITLITIVWNKKVLQPKGNMLLRITEITGLALIIIYSIIQQWWLPAAYSGAGLVGLIFGLYFEYGSVAQKYLVLDDSGIIIQKPGMNRKILWQDIKNIIYKNNIFTIDCRNNKLYQFFVNETAPAEKNPVILFAMNQIKEKEHLYKPDW